MTDCSCPVEMRPPTCPHKGDIAICTIEVLTDALDAAAGLVERLSPPNKERHQTAIKHIKAVDEWARFGNVVEPRQ